MRLDKFIANNSSYSRTEVKRLIKNKTVCVDKKITTDAGFTVTSQNTIRIDGEIIEAIKPLYIMLNKPTGYVCANKDNIHSPVVDLITEQHALQSDQTPPKYRAQSLQIAGRLDVDTTGLVLLTDNGDWNHRVTSPKKACFKRYRVNLEKPLDDTAIKLLCEGVMLHGEKAATLPATVELISNTEVLLSIQEGRFHQVKRMFVKVGNCVVKLHREAIGTIELDTNLKPGQWRHLTNEEIEAIN
ncbi:pseudouridine synthase [Saccharophagus degradans]|uniref:Pseudouridine synthase n=1 Tax=Saccharophagus degradans TaxID=86304 RepID=A0AAW7X1R8_9GAMM|nr:16S rRNA pseudouridine(516) synthase [Saccharophagus degradans]MDO6421265.1 16S rRNA pseudouridine(516) synthase [Saccharophagus degradans]MDO6605824.1 16S rRNA pseudouridine(516) synthase [Saccharophagus degradans]